MNKMNRDDLQPIAGIYIIINTALNKVYIGQSIDIFRRINQHYQELQKGTHHNKDMQRDYDKSPSAFQWKILQKCYLSQLNFYEKYYIKQYNSANPYYGYNHTKGGATKKRKNKDNRPTDLLDELTK